MTRPRMLVLTRLGGVALMLASCASGPEGERGPIVVEPARSVFVVPRSSAELAGSAFFDHPFPSDWRRDASGVVSFEGFPNPANIPLLRDYVGATRGLLTGFSTAAAITLRFDGPLDPATLPKDPTASLANDASVQIVDVDPASPDRGLRHLAQVRFRAEAGVYAPANALAVLPMLGRPLRPKTRYAVVVTNKVRTASGGVVSRSADLERVLVDESGDARYRVVHDLLAPAVSELERAGVPKPSIVHLTTFTTNDPTEEMFAAMDDVSATTAPPLARDWRRVDDGPALAVYEGIYGPSPDYQRGDVPFRRPADGGGFELGSDGRPKVQRTFDLRFALAVPDEASCPPPISGYPIVLYAHGTGGDYRSFVRDGTARSLASVCLASMGIDQIFHGTRPGAPALGDPAAETTTSLLFFNLDNVVAARTSNRQSAIDVVQQARLFTESHLTVPSSVSMSGRDIDFDGTSLGFFGHSQGGLNGPLALAGSGLLRGGVLSGATSNLGLSLLGKTKPVDVAAGFRMLVGLGDPEHTSELDVFHPVMTLVQSLIDVADPLLYGAYIARTPRPGLRAKSIYQTEGVDPTGKGDSYAPPYGIEALAVAIGLPRQLPGVRVSELAGWAGIADVTIPSDGLRGNIADGTASGVLAQFIPREGRDGHFVAFDDAIARAQAAGFLRSLADDPVGAVPPPRIP